MYYVGNVILWKIFGWKRICVIETVIYWTTFLSETYIFMENVSLEFEKCMQIIGWRYTIPNKYVIELPLYFTNFN